MTSATHKWQRATIGQTKPIRFGPVTFQGKTQNLTGATVTVNVIRAGHALGIDHWPYAYPGLGPWQGELSLSDEACTIPSQSTARGMVDWTPGADDLDGLGGEVLVQFKIVESGGGIYYWPERLGEVGLSVNPRLESAE